MNQERREKAIAWIKEEIRSLERAPELNGCPMTPEWAAQLEIMRTCLEAVQDHFPDTTKMVPLTMEQLLGMDGQPVRVHNLRPSKKKFEWQNALVCKFRETAEHSFYTYWFRDYGKTWLAYAYHISRIDREAWECPLCKSCKVISFEAWKDESEFPKGPSVRGAAFFCPFCGKPLTPEAWAKLEKRIGGSANA